MSFVTTAHPVAGMALWKQSTGSSSVRQKRAAGLHQWMRQLSIHLLVFLTTVMRNGHSNYILITLIYMCLNAKQMSLCKHYKQCRHSVIFLTLWLKKRENEENDILHPSAKYRTKPPKTKHSPLSLVFPSALLTSPPPRKTSPLSAPRNKYYIMRETNSLVLWLY